MIIRLRDSAGLSPWRQRHCSHGLVGYVAGVLKGTLLLLKAHSHTVVVRFEIDSSGLRTWR